MATIRVQNIYFNVFSHLVRKKNILDGLYPPHPPIFMDYLSGLSKIIYLNSIWWFLRNFGMYQFLEMSCLKCYNFKFCLALFDEKKNALEIVLILQHRIVYVFSIKEFRHFLRKNPKFLKIFQMLYLSYHVLTNEATLKFLQKQKSSMLPTYEEKKMYIIYAIRFYGW